MQHKFHHSPTHIQRLGTEGVRITWSDSAVQELSSEVLRRACPCAECREKRGDESHARPLTGKKRSLQIVESSIKEELELTGIWGVGQYAIGMKWGDNHDSGIYTFDYLRSL